MKNNIGYGFLLASMLLLPNICFSEMISQDNGKAASNFGVKVFFAGFSSHINESGNPNESHKLLGISYKRWDAIRMKNSYRRTSVVVARNNNFFEKKYSVGKVELNIRTGISSGYDKAKRSFGGFIPVVQPNIYMEHSSGLGIEFGLIPYSGEQSDGVVTMNVSYIF